MATTQTTTKLSVGDTAPDFDTTLQDGSSFSLSNELKSGKKVLLIFYPGDMTPGCTQQLCSVRDVYGDYKKYGVTVLGVNHADGTSHQQFIDKHSYPFDIIVDADRAIAKQYGLIGSFFGKPTTKRTVFLIDTDGIILYRFAGIHDNQKIFDVLEKNV